jgi:hypothetical protein
VVVWAEWTIKLTLNRNDEGPGIPPGLFSCVGLKADQGAQRAVTTEAEVQRFAGTKIWVMLEKNSRIVASFSSTIDQLRLLGT